MTVIQRIGAIIVLGFIIFILIGTRANKKTIKKMPEKEARGLCVLGLLLAAAIIMLIP